MRPGVVIRGCGRGRAMDNVIGDDVYNAAREQSFREFEAIDESAVATASLDFSLSNSSNPTDYDAWTQGSERFADDNYEAMKRWVN